MKLFFRTSKGTGNTLFYLNLIKIWFLFQTLHFIIKEIIWMQYNCLMPLKFSCCRIFTLLSFVIHVGLSLYFLSLYHQVMNEKLNYCIELMELLNNKFTDARHTKLEWMIIVLIMIEVNPYSWWPWSSRSR